MSEIGIAVLSGIGLIVVMGVLGWAGRNPPTSDPPLTRMSLPKDWRKTPHPEDWPIVRIPDCDHVFDHIGGDRQNGGEIEKCTQCGCNQISFYIGTLHPGQSAGIDFGVQVDDD